MENKNEKDRVVFNMPDKLEFDLAKYNIHATHIDLDGLSPLVIDAVFGVNNDYNEIFCCNYDDGDREETLLSTLKREKAETLGVLVFTDFTPNVRIRQVIDEKKIHTYIFDHHASEDKEKGITLFEDLYNWAQGKDYIHLDLDDTRCGTKIYYDYMSPNYKHSEALEQYVSLVDTYDLFQKERLNWNMASDLNCLMYYMRDFDAQEFDDKSIVYAPFITSQVWKGRYNEYRFTDYEQKKIDKARAKEKEIITGYATKKEWFEVRQDKEGLYFVIFKNRAKISVIADWFLTTYPKLDYAIGINTYDDECWKISARSKEYDLMKIKGFAGHANACGYSGDDLSNQFCEELISGKRYCFDKIED